MCWVTHGASDTAACDRSIDITVYCWTSITVYVLYFVELNFRRSQIFVIFANHGSPAGLNFVRWKLSRMAADPCEHATVIDCTEPRCTCACAHTRTHIRTHGHMHMHAFTGPLLCSVLSARTRSQRKRELEMEVAQLKKQVKQKRKAALNSSGIGVWGVGGYVSVPWRVLVARASCSIVQEGQNRMSGV